jgi:DNA-binding GntR family transcriptional regulator
MNASTSSKTDLMYAQIVSSIVEHRITPGTKFREEQLAALFEVSRTQVRKVLQQLEHEGLVSKQHRKGVTVAAPTLEETQEIFEARRLIEPWVVTRLCGQCKPQALQALNRIVKEEHRAHVLGERHVAVRLSGDFHRALAAAAENKAITKTMEGLTIRTCLAILANQASTEVTCRDDEHQKIIEAIEAKNTKLASRLMLAHLKHIESSLDKSDSIKPSESLETMLNVGMPSKKMMD